MRAEALVEGGELGAGEIEGLVLQFDDVDREVAVHPAGEVAEHPRVAHRWRQVAVESLVDPQRCPTAESHVLSVGRWRRWPTTATTLTAARTTSDGSSATLNRCC